MYGVWEMPKEFRHHLNHVSLVRIHKPMQKLLYILFYSLSGQDNSILLAKPQITTGKGRAKFIVQFCLPIELVKKCKNVRLKAQFSGAVVIVC